jgi:anaerobic selenocysteine-containing dehydrogenase
VAKATFAGTDKANVVDWDHLVADYGRIRDKIENTLPKLFKDFNKRIEQPGGFNLGNSARDRAWTTATGKANFVTAPLAELRLPEDQLRLMTLRSHDQYNTTIYDLDDRYRGIYGTRKVILLNGLDIQARKLRDGDMVDITSHTIEDGRKREAHGFRVVEYDIPQGCAACYFPETNVLVSVNSFADKSRTPLSKYIPITVVKAGAAKSESARQPSETGATAS